MPLNTTPPAVDSTPAQDGVGCLISHLRSPVSGSIARSAPVRRLRRPADAPAHRAIAGLVARRAALRRCRSDRSRARSRRTGRVRGSNDGDMKLVPPNRSGQVSVPFARRPLIGQLDRPAVGADLLRPGLVHERLGVKELAVGAIEHVEEAVAIGHHHDLARLAGDREVGEHRNLVRVPVVRVVRRELEVPLQRAGVGVERDERARVEVVALAIVAVEIGVRIAGAPVDEVAARDRRSRSATSARRRVPTTSAGQVSLPGSPGAGTVQKRHARLPVLASYASRNPRIANSPPAMPTMTLSLTMSGARRAGVALLVVGDLDVPDHLAGLHVERDEMRVERRHDRGDRRRRRSRD